MFDISLDQNKTIRILIEDSTELILQSSNQYVTITRYSSEGKPTDTFTIFKNVSQNKKH